MNQNGLQITEAATPARKVATEICFSVSDSTLNTVVNKFLSMRKKKKKLPYDTTVPIKAIYNPLYKLINPSVFSKCLNAFKSSDQLKDGIFFF